MLQKLSDGIEEISEENTAPELSEQELQDIAEQQDSQITESNDYDTRSLREIAREKLTEKLEQGYDLSNKEEKSRICHEIANEIQNIKGSCSYQTVSAEVNHVLKVKKKKDSETKEGTKQVEGHTIKIKKSGKVNRPARNEPDSSETNDSSSELNEFERKMMVLKQFEEKGESAEEMMIKFTLQDVSFFIQAFGLPKPQTKRLEQRARQIALWNEMQRVKGTPENVISISDNVLKPLMMLGLVTTFAEPIVKKYFPPNGKKKDNSGIEVSEKSLRD